MKVDKDDVPDYLKPRKKQGPWRTLAVMGVGSAIFWGLVTVFAKPIVIDVVQLKQAIRFGGEPIFSQQPAQPQHPPAEALLRQRSRLDQIQPSPTDHPSEPRA